MMGKILIVDHSMNTIVMKKPRKIKDYCPNCDTHTDMEITEGKNRPGSELRKGQRRFRRVTSGYGGFPWSKPSGPGKPVKRAYLKYTCSECGKTWQKKCQRAGRVEFEE